MAEDIFANLQPLFPQTQRWKPIVTQSQFEWQMVECAPFFSSICSTLIARTSPFNRITHISPVFQMQEASSTQIASHHPQELIHFRTGYRIDASRNTKISIASCRRPIINYHLHPRNFHLLKPLSLISHHMHCNHFNSHLPWLALEPYIGWNLVLKIRWMWQIIEHLLANWNTFTCSRNNHEA